MHGNRQGGVAWTRLADTCRTVESTIVIAVHQHPTESVDPSIGRHKTVVLSL
jgi:hypothetical protein